MVFPTNAVTLNEKLKKGWFAVDAGKKDLAALPRQRVDP